MPSQIAIPVQVNPDEIARKQTLGVAALELCAEIAGYALDKELQQAMEVDKAQFSRWLAGTEGVVWPKLERFMDKCGNDAPILWMLYRRGYDINTLHKRETETEKELRKVREELAKSEEKRHYLESLHMGRAA